MGQAPVHLRTIDLLDTVGEASDNNQGAGDPVGTVDRGVAMLGSAFEWNNIHIPTPTRRSTRGRKPSEIGLAYDAD